MSKALPASFIEAGNAFDNYDFGAEWKSDTNVLLAEQFTPEFLQCPSSPSRVEQNGGFEISASDYALSKGPDGYLYRRNVSVGMFDVNVETSLADIRDGTSNTFMLGEAASDPQIEGVDT